MKKIFFSILIGSCTGISFSQNVGVSTDGTLPETGVMLDVKGTSSFSVTAQQNIFQVKSNDASTDALKLRLGLQTHATAGSRYGVIDVPEYSGGAVSSFRNLILQPSSGNVGIGTISPGSTLAVHSSNIAVITSGGGGNLAVNTTNAQAADVGAWLTLGGFYDATQITPFAAIFGRKENSTSGQYPGYLVLATSKQGTGLVEAMRITSTGNVGIGTPTPGALLDVKGAGGAAMARVVATSGRASLVLGSVAGNTSGPIITWEKQGVGEFAMYTYNGAAKLAIVDASTGNDAFSIMGGKTTVGNGSGISGNSSLNVYGNAAVGTTYYNTAAPANGMIVEGNVGIGTTNPTSKLQVTGLPVYANNAAALAGGLTAGALYTTGAGDPRPVYIVF